jgi:hypothetical protein
MSPRNALDALAVTDPTPLQADDDALLQQILAAERRRERRRKPLVLAMAAAALLAAGAWTYQHFGNVDDKELRPLVLDARKDVPLPPGARWSPLPAEILGKNTFTPPEAAQEMALMEAKCHWERYWVDSPAAAAAAAGGYDDIVRRMRAVYGLRLVVDDFARAGDEGRRGDFALVRQDLRVNCSPAQGGTATTLTDLEGRLAESGQPAVALVLARANPDSLPSEQENAGDGALFARIDSAVGGDGSGTTFGESGRDYGFAVFHPRDLDAAPAQVRKLLEGRTVVPGSFILVWRGPGDETRIPLP